jgi:dihydroflavonol-4-reductase
VNLVTGGAGFIGSHLVERLLLEREAVRVLERPGAAVDHLPLERIELVRVDVRDRKGVRAALRDCRHVYHLAANPNLWVRDRREFDAVNHQGTVHVLEAALEAGAERVLHTSTESIVASPSFDGGAAEHLRPRDSDMVGPYCLSKLRAEQVAFRLADHGAPVIVVSPTLPVGPGDRNQTPPTRLSVAFCRGRVPAIVDCALNFVDVRDAAAGMVAAMRRGRPGIRYMLGAENLSLRAWLGLVGPLVGRLPPRRVIPYPLALAVGRVSEWIADHVTGRMPMATVTGVRLTRRCMYFDPKASWVELGLWPRSVAESARDAVDWYRRVGWIG